MQAPHHFDRMPLSATGTGRLLAVMHDAPPVGSPDRATFLAVILAELIDDVTPERWDEAVALAKRAQDAEVGL